MIKIKSPKGCRTLAWAGEPLPIDQLIADAGEALTEPCGGRGKCGKCLVYVSGDVSAPGNDERGLLTSGQLADGLRLACRAKIIGSNAEITVPDSQTFAGLADGAAVYRVDKPLGADFGVAVDIGTTTVAVYLCDLKTGTVLASKAKPNEQRIFGADVVSRIEASLGGHRAELAQLVRRTIGELTEELLTSIGRRTEELDAAVICGNTAMLYMLTGEDVTSIAFAPFKADDLFGRFVPADSLMPSWPKTCRLYLPRCISAYVGADITCGIVSSGQETRASGTLLVDIGTNGEMVLKTDDGLLCCSTAAGPALEGVGISMGSCAVPGAIDRVWLEDGTMAVHTIENASAASICGSGLLDAVSCLLQTDQIDETGAMDEDYVFLGNTDVRLLQRDIRQVQMAKAAIRAGMETMLHHASLSKPTELLLAGGFGSFLNPISAQRIGLLPETAELPSVLGNSAGQGAVMLLLSENLCRMSETMTEQVKLIELSTDPFFKDEFIEQMSFE